MGLGLGVGLRSRATELPMPPRRAMVPEGPRERSPPKAALSLSLSAMAAFHARS